MRHRKLEDIPFTDLKELAIQRTLENANGDIDDSIFGAFYWDKTPEGGNYWTHVYKILLKETINRSDLKRIIK